MPMADKRVLITGSSRGIGRAIALRLAKEGWQIALHYANDEAEAEKTRRALGAKCVGVYQAAKDNGKLAIGVDSNQNYLQPGTMLTSMMKRVDLAVYNAFMSSKNGTWKPGVTSRGLAEDGAGWALDDNNKALITADMQSKVDQAKQDIISGKIKVVDYTAAKSCPD